MLAWLSLQALGERILQGGQGSEKIHCRPSLSPVVSFLSSLLLTLSLPPGPGPESFWKCPRWLDAFGSQQVRLVFESLLLVKALWGDGRVIIGIVIIAHDRGCCFGFYKM